MASLNSLTVTGTLQVTGEITYKPPVGFLYFQLESKSTPATLWSGTSWTNRSSVYPGAFFRAEGGGSPYIAQTWDENTPANTQQASLMKQHNHSTSSVTHTYDRGASSGWGGGTIAYGYNGICAASTGRGPVATTYQYGLADVNINASHSHAVSTSYSGGVEHRPLNYVIRVWERTS
jgi:hypothetical protein